MDVAAAMREALANVDVGLARRVWALSPHLPQPKDDAEALATLHMARTGAASVPLAMRAWSHRWLLERGLPSQLPDAMKPAAERVYPVTSTSVGISVKSKYPVVQAAIRGAMEQAVLDVYANGDQANTDLIRQRMQEARSKEKRGLGL